jgi:hypothetical protein
MFLHFYSYLLDKSAKETNNDMQNIRNIFTDVTKKVSSRTDRWFKDNSKGNAKLLLTELRKFRLTN